MFCTYYDRLVKEYNQIEKQIKKIQEEIDTLPEGKLVITHNKDRYKWYVSHNGITKYLPKSQRALAEALAKKKYLLLQLNDLAREKNAIQFLLNRNQGKTNEVEQLLSNPPFQELLFSEFKLESQECNNWMNTPYERNMSYPEHLTHKSISGNVLRSKSESLIDMILYTSKIPFRYECSLNLGEKVIYPDFTILHPLTKEIFYWEHFGMMDYPMYAKSAYSKLQLYSSNNFFPSINLITTYETKDHPLSAESINKIVKHYFL